MIMKSGSVSFGSIVPEFCVRFDFRELSARDQTTLFNALAEHLGITDATHARPDESYQVLWKEMMGRVWGADK
jgi:hypothetical protein